MAAAVVNLLLAGYFVETSKLSLEDYAALRESRQKCCNEKHI